MCRTSFQQITHPDDLSGEARLLAGMLDRRSASYPMQERYRCGNGEWIWCLVAVALARNGSGAADYPGRTGDHHPAGPVVGQHRRGQRDVPAVG